MQLDWPSVLFRWFWCPLLLECCHMSISQSLLANNHTSPLIGVILTTLLCASPIGQVAVVLKAQGAQLIIPVALLHAAAFALGYWCSRLSSFGESTSRTISIECGMQSSALGFLLAQKHFTNPLVAVPSACIGSQSFTWWECPSRVLEEQADSCG
ncbi:unnamed protein product [Musa acuminata subsp. burmannicoides]